MKTFAAQRLLGLVLFTWLGAGLFSYADEIPVVLHADAQRAAIEETRRIQTRRLDELATECERKFTVTQCLDQVHAERLGIESKLNRQETLLNDTQRQERGSEQMERNREKAAAQAEKLANLANAPAVQTKQPKLAGQPGAQATPRQLLSAAREPSLSVSERSAHARDYQRKQADAIIKRAEVAKRLKEAGVKKPSLPIPE